MSIHGFFAVRKAIAIGVFLWVVLLHCGFLSWAFGDVLVDEYSGVESMHTQYATFKINRKSDGDLSARERKWTRDDKVDTHGKAEDA